jgi:hypothetical protein
MLSMVAARSRQRTAASTALCPLSAESVEMLADAATAPLGEAFTAGVCGHPGGPTEAGLDESDVIDIALPHRARSGGA